MSWDEMYELLRAHVGERARVTIRNGVGRICVTPAGLVGTWREHLTLGGRLVGGEYSNAVRVEVLGANGRYREVTS